MTSATNSPSSRRPRPPDRHDGDGARSAAASDADREYTVDSLAAAADTMTTTVRMYQARGLLPAPTRRGRVAIYTTAHLRRLELIADLQRRGHSLAGIGELLRGAAEGRPLTELVGVTTWGVDRRITISPAELVARFAPATMTAEELQRGAALGLVEADGADLRIDERFLDVGTRLVALGVSFAAILDEWEHLSSATARVAERFAALFEKELWPSLQHDGAALERIADVVDRLGPLAQQVTSLALERALVAEMDRFVAGHTGIERHA